MYRIIAIRYISTYIPMRDLLGWLAEKLVIHRVTSHFVDDVGRRAV
jgi:hypothetical protein